MCPSPSWNESSIKVDLMLPAVLESEFDCAWRNRTQEHRKHLADAGEALDAFMRGRAA